MSVEDFQGQAEWAAGQVQGVRSWGVDAVGRLHGVAFKQVWRPGVNEAECRVSEDAWGRLNQKLLAATLQIGVSTAPHTYQGAYYIPDRGVVQPGPVAENPSPVEEPPHTMLSCRCGFYGYYDGSNDYADKKRVSGIVQGFGETVIGSRGFRSMKAKIVALHLPKDVSPVLGSRLRLVARNYPDVPMFESFDAMVDAFPPDPQYLKTPANDPDFWDRPVAS